MYRQNTHIPKIKTNLKLQEVGAGVVGKKRMNSVTQSSHRCLLFLWLFPYTLTEVQCTLLLFLVRVELQLLYMRTAQRYRHTRGGGMLGFVIYMHFLFLFVFQTLVSSNSRFFCLSLLSNWLGYKFLFPPVYQRGTKSGGILRPFQFRSCDTNGLDKMICQCRDG